MTACSRRSFLASLAMAACGRTAVGAAISGRPRLGPLLWSRRLRRREIAAGPAAHSIIPAAGSGRLYLPLVDRVLAVDLSTGGPAWPSGEADDDGALFRSGTESGPASIGVVTSAELAEGRLVTLTGDLRRMETEVQGIALFPTVSCCDVEKSEGKLLWTQEISGTLASAGWRAAAPACVSGPSIWLPVASRLKQERALAELDAVTGAVRGIIPVAPRDGEAAGWAAASPLCADGRVFCRRTDGGIVAVSTTVRRVIWESAPRPQTADRLVGSPLRVGDGMAFVASPGRVIQALDGETGRIRWEFALGEANPQLCGVTGRHLVCAGRRVWVLDAATGTPLERWGFADEPPAGRVALSGGLLAWSTVRELFVLDPARGAVIDRYDLAMLPEVRGGDVWVFENHLVLMGAGRASVFAFTPG